MFVAGCCLDMRVSFTGRRPGSKAPVGLCKTLVEVSDIFNFFSGWGGGRESPRRRDGRANGFLSKIPGGGGGVLWEGEGTRGREGVCGELGKFWGGGGLNFFFGTEMYKFSPIFLCRAVGILG